MHCLYQLSGHNSFCDARTSSESNVFNIFAILNKWTKLYTYTIKCFPLSNRSLSICHLFQNFLQKRVLMLVFQILTTIDIRNKILYIKTKTKYKLQENIISSLSKDEFLWWLFDRTYQKTIVSKIQNLWLTMTDLTWTTESAIDLTTCSLTGLRQKEMTSCRVLRTSMSLVGCDSITLWTATKK